MKKKLLLLTISMMILFTTACGNKVKLKDGKEVIASVDGKDFTAEELFDKLKDTYGTDVLVNMIDEFIIDEEIKDSSSYEEAAKAQLNSMKSYYEQYDYEWADVLSYYGFSDDDAFLEDYIKKAKKEDIIKKYLKEEVTEDEIDEYYEQEIYGDYTVKHILITPETSDDMTDEEKEEAKDKALDEANEAIEKLNGGDSWTEVTKKYSDDTQTKDDEGNLPAFTNGDYADEFFDAVLDLKDGEYTDEPVESTYGYHIIYRVSATDKPSKKDSNDKILEGIVTNKIKNDEKLSNQTWISIREKYELKISDSTISKKYNKSLEA